MCHSCTMGLGFCWKSSMKETIYTSVRAKVDAGHCKVHLLLTRLIWMVAWKKFGFYWSWLLLIELVPIFSLAEKLTLPICEWYMFFSTDFSHRATWYDKETIGNVMSSSICKSSEILFPSPVTHKHSTDIHCLLGKSCLYNTRNEVDTWDIHLSLVVTTSSK